MPPAGYKPTRPLMCCFFYSVAHWTCTGKHCFVLFSTDPVAVNVVLVPGSNIQLLCKAHSNLAQLYWRHSGQILHPDNKYFFSYWGLLIVNACKFDSGLYICDSVENSIGRRHNVTVAVYQLQMPPVRTTTTTLPPANSTKPDKIETSSILNTDNNLAKQSVTVTILVGAVIVLSLACTSLSVVLIWKIRRGRFRSFEVAQRTDKSTHEKKSDHWLQAIKPLNSIDKDNLRHSSGNGDHGPDSMAETGI